MTRKLLSLLLFACTLTTASAKVKLPALFGDHMVLQQQSNVAIWGEAKANKTVTITPSWSKKSIKTKSDADGKWSTTIPTPEASASKSYTLTLSDGEKLTLNDVLIGEVWLSSGQSNIEMPMKGFGSQPVEGASDYIMAARKSTPIRICTATRAVSNTPQDDFKATWSVNTPKEVAKMSATSYLFAHALNSHLDIPIGIVVSSWGGTPIEAWMKREMFAKYPQFTLDHLEEGGEIKGRPQAQPAMLYNAMINPLTRFTFKGVIWYQGETNRGRSAEYAELFPDFVKMLREDLNNPEMPFYYVQIAPYFYDNSQAFSSALIREAQLNTLKKVKNAGMVVTLDIGDEWCIHPARKIQVGKRLANLALCNDYGFEGIEADSPTVKKIAFNDGAAEVTFTKRVGPLGRQLDSFEIAGEDKVFYPAEAMVDHPTGKIIVKSAKVAEPVAVRYAFHNFAEATIFSSFGLPVSSFRSDNWAVEE